MARSEKAQIFCFHHAGGSSLSYRKWAGFFSNNIEFICVDYPGRNHAHSLPMANFNQLLDFLQREFVHYCALNHRISFYGHSMGALVATELAKRLWSQSIQIEHLFVSSCVAPSFFKPAMRSSLSDSDLIEQMIGLGGLGVKRLSQKALKTILPVMRADIAIVETFLPNQTVSLEIPITVFLGSSDPRTPFDLRESWKVETKGPVQKHLYDGGHFFNFKESLNLVRAMEKKLSC